MKIKKVNDKPIVIHTKKKAKLHTHEPKKASIKASNIYTVDRSPKIKGSKIATTENKKFRRSTIHPVDKAKKGMFRQYRAALKEFKQSIKTKNSSIKMSIRNCVCTWKLGKQGIDGSHMKCRNEVFQFGKKDTNKSGNGRFQFCSFSS